MNTSAQVLDCTLRDGGYYNNWNFETNLVKEYINSLVKSNIDIVEIGFRFINRNAEYGEYAYSNDNLIRSLHIPSSIKVAVMIDAKEYSYSDELLKQFISENFVRKSDSRVDIVRVATTIDNISLCQEISNELHKLGYQVFLNLMQVDLLNEQDLIKTLKKVDSWNVIDAFYFADSFGNMSTDSVIKILKLIKQNWQKKIGIHAHDNKGHALINSLTAYNHGVDFIDSTIQGMGRGAGNTKTENLLVEINDKSNGRYNPDAIFPLALNEFQELKKIYNWGSSIFYYLSAVHGIHPTYIQEMTSDERYTTQQILDAINVLKDKVSSTYNIESLLEALSQEMGDDLGGWSAENFGYGKEALIIGSGPSSVEYLAEIKDYIVRKNPLVFCLNVNKEIPSEIVDYYVACHESRIAIELAQYAKLKKPLIIPKSRIPVEVKNFFKNVKIIDYGLKISNGESKSGKNGCTLKSPLVLIYLLNLLNESAITKVFLTGIDGYLASNKKQDEMVHEIKNITSKTNLELISLTPTSYSIDTKIFKKI